MKKIKYIGIALAFTLTMSACEQEVVELKQPETQQPVPDCPSDATAGTADFSKYIAIGNSLTAGFQAGALFNEGQQNSLGKILATQFACVGGGEFNQPDINSEFGFYLGGSNPTPEGVFLGRLLLQGTPAGPKPTVSNEAASPGRTEGFLYGGDKTKLNNFAVPLITLRQIFQSETGNWLMADVDQDAPGAQPHPYFNPLYARFATPGGTILDDAYTALENGGSFFSFWLGNNDVLGYARSGASNLALLTSEENFGNDFEDAIEKLLSVPNVKGVVGNIPDINVIPYFNLVPHNPVPMTSQDMVDMLNEGYALYNGGLDLAAAGQLITAEERDRRKIHFQLGANAVVIVDESLTDLSGLSLPSYRHATAEDRLVLTASNFIGTTVNGDPTKVNGVSVPLGDEWVLVPAEQTLINERTAAFNEIIANVVATYSDRLALADVNAMMNQLASSQLMIVDGVTITPSLAPPSGGFSEDGIHPNSRGIALAANVFIDAINAKFGAKVPRVNVAKYKGTALPVNP